MYEKLIKSLRVEPFEVESVGLAKTMNEAADAIEELQKRVPKRPHGRLIDADALCMKLKMMYAQAFADGNSAYHSAYRSLEKVVNAAPTIIPPEEGE